MATGEGRMQPRREGEHFVSLRDEQIQWGMEIRSVENFILDRVVSGHLQHEDAKELSTQLHAPGADVLQIMGVVIDKTGFTDGF